LKKLEKGKRSIEVKDKIRRKKEILMMKMMKMRIQMKTRLRQNKVKAISYKLNNKHHKMKNSKASKTLKIKPNKAHLRD